MNLSDSTLNAYQKIAADRQAQLLRRRWVAYVEKSLREGDRAFSDFAEWCQSQGQNKPAAQTQDNPWAKVEAQREAEMRAKQVQIDAPTPPDAA